LEKKIKLVFVWPIRSKSKQKYFTEGKSKQKFYREKTENDQYYNGVKTY